MIGRHLSRRRLLQRSVPLLLGLPVMFHIGRAAADAGTPCADPAKMDGSQRSARDSLHYSESSPDPAKTCSACSFFQPGAAACGSCMIFNGPANPKGHCDSWNSKD
jgi:hypothetical protein